MPPIPPVYRPASSRSAQLAQAAEILRPDPPPVYRQAVPSGVQTRLHFRPTANQFAPATPKPSCAAQTRAATSVQTYSERAMPLASSSQQAISASAAPPVYCPKPQVATRLVAPAAYRPHNFIAVLRAPVKKDSTCCQARLATQVSFARPLRAMGNIGGQAIQRVKCTVKQNEVALGEHEIGQGGIGGVSHAEQESWAKAKKRISGDSPIQFSVDGPICGDCTKWFETTMYGIARKRGLGLLVEVNYQEFHGTIEVTGESTSWGLVSEEGYFKHQREQNSAERAGMMAAKKAQKEEAEERERERRSKQPMNKKKATLEAKGNRLQEQDSIFG